MSASGDIAVGAGAFGAGSEEYERPGSLRRVVRAWLRKPLGLFGLVVIIILSALAIGAPLLQRYEPSRPFQMQNPNYNPDSTNFYTDATDQFILDKLSPPNTAHWLGTDSAGRDIWSRIVWGARRSLKISIASLLLGVAGGTFLGIASGYFGGWFDTLTQRLLDAMQAFPPLLLLILAATAFKLSERNVILAFALIAVPQVSRIVRGNTLALREMPFIEAGKVLGATNTRVMVRHILPNSWAAIIIVFSIGIGTIIVTEAALAFLAVTPPGISWGNMLNEGVSFYKSSPWQSLFGGTAITLAVLAFNLLGDALRDILDPRLKI